MAIVGPSSWPTVSPDVRVTNVDVPSGEPIATRSVPARRSTSLSTRAGPLSRAHTASPVAASMPVSVPSTIRTTVSAFEATNVRELGDTVRSIDHWATPVSASSDCSTDDPVGAVWAGPIATRTNRRSMTSTQTSSPSAAGTDRDQIGSSVSGSRLGSAPAKGTPLVATTSGSSYRSTAGTDVEPAGSSLLLVTNVTMVADIATTATMPVTVTATVPATVVNRGWGRGRPTVADTGSCSDRGGTGSVSRGKLTGAETGAGPW